ncbi:MAG: S8 family serine peptidase [Chloroflexota bacterium]
MFLRYTTMLIFSALILSACNLDTTGANPTDSNTVVTNPTAVVQPTTDTSTNVQPTENIVVEPTSEVILPPTTVPVEATPIPAEPTAVPAEPTIAPTSNNQPLPTHTPSSGGTEPETEATVPVPVTSSDDCEAVASAAGVVIDAEEQRENAPRTLPDGSPFPNTEPRSAGFTPQAARSSVASDTGFAGPTIIIVFTPGSSVEARTAYIDSIGAEIQEEIAPLNTYILLGAPNYNIFTAPESDIVVNIEYDQVAQSAQSDTDGSVADPNDPRYGEQWAFPVVGLPEAWGTLPGRTVTVAVIDSGICANHPDLQGRITAGYDFVDDDNDPNDTFGHGCGVAGVIAANTNNGIGIAGIAPNVQIMPLRVLDNLGLGSYSNIANAIIYAVDNGADIINLSLAGPTSSVMLEAAVAYAVDSGVVVIAAAGNFGQPNAFYPAAYPSVIAVASIDPVTFERSSFSNYGADVDVLAPGRDILTTNLVGDYEFVSGTSFAAPIVAGITAMSEALNTPLNTEDGIVFLYPPDALPNCP